MKKNIFNVLMVVALLLSFSTAVFAGEGVEQPSYPTGSSNVFLPMINGYASSMQPSTPALGSLQLENAIRTDNKLDRSLEGLQGEVQVSITLAGDPVAKLYEDGVENLGDAVKDRYNEILAQQAAFMDYVNSLDGNAVKLGAAQRLLNLVMVTVDASTLSTLADNPDVVAIKPVVDYELDLSETVPYIGASAVQDLGFTGAGITVAVIDSGIDYTHEEFGGEGQAAYDANDPSYIEEGTFPTVKVVDGFDFVGAEWPNGDLAPDPDPLDKPTYGDGHGTHVADIIGGASGVAPDVDLIALKACSSVASACSGVALIQSMEYAVDPNGDGKLDDAVDIINMSLGALYGNPYYDDLSLAVNAASSIGVLSVVAAGNADDKPYIVDTPSSAPAAISVAATHVPSAFTPLMEVTAPDDITGLYVAVWQSWSAEPINIEAPVVYAGTDYPDNATGCDPFPADAFTGKIALVDRGDCTFTSKILNLEAGGAVVGIIGLIAPGEPFDGGWGGEGYPTIPGYMISLADSNTLKSGLPETTVKFDPAVGVPAVGTMESYSSRGPSPWMNYIKPEIGAPSSSVSAKAGTGDGMTGFGGTSGATPMVAGSAALVKQYMLQKGLVAPALDIPAVIKSMLVNSGETEIRDKPLDFFGGELSPISRIGGGEVRVDRAIESPITLWEEGAVGMHLPTLSYGLQDVTGVTVIEKVVAVNNWTNDPLVYDLSSTFRYAEDDNGAVTIEVVPEQLEVPGQMQGKVPEAYFVVRMTIDGEKLNDWTMNSGSRGNSGATLTANEYDGYVWLDNVATTDDDDAMIHMPWHVLPRKADYVTANPTELTFTDGMGAVDFTNSGVQVAELDAYDWVFASPELPPEGGMGDQYQQVDLKDVGVMTYPVPAGYCSADPSFVYAIGITTYDRQALAVPNPIFDVLLDTNQDGEWDYDVFNFDLSLSGSINDGRSVVWVQDLATNAVSAYFFLGHPTNSANYYLLLCGEQIGMNADNFFQPMDVMVMASDWYYSGDVTDYTDIFEVSPLGERYLAIGDYVAPGTTETWTVYDFGPDGTNPTAMGVMLLLGDAPEDNENMVLPVAAP